MRRITYVHHDNPSLVAVAEKQGEDRYNLVIWNLGQETARSVNIDRLHYVVNGQNPYNVKLFVADEPTEEIEHHLREFKFFDSDLTDHHDQELDFHLDLGGGE